MSVQYLTNIDKSEATRVRVERAAAASGIDVRYHEHPMPADDPMDLDDGYSPDLVPNSASIALHDTGVGDCSAFWAAYDAAEVSA